MRPRRRRTKRGILIGWGIQRRLLNGGAIAQCGRDRNVMAASEPAPENDSVGKLFGFGPSRNWSRLAKPANFPFSQSNGVE
jgi:hypothetical protein